MDQCPACVVRSGEQARLRRALATSDVVGQAKGLLMAAKGCGADEANRTLAVRAQHERRSVPDVAGDLVAEHDTATCDARPAPLLHLVPDS